MKQFEEWFKEYHGGDEGAHMAEYLYKCKDLYSVIFKAGWDAAMKEVDGRRCAGCEHDGTFSILDDDKCMYCKRYNKSLRDNFKNKE